jgi:hypothetical protein
VKPRSSRQTFLAGKTIDFPVSKKSYSDFLQSVKLPTATRRAGMSPAGGDADAAFFSSKKQ